MKKLFSLSLVLTVMFVCSSNFVFAAAVELDAFIQHMTTEIFWWLGAPAMSASLLGLMFMQKGVRDHNQATFFFGALIPVLTAGFFFGSMLLSGSCAALINDSFIAFCLTFVPFIPTLVLYWVLGKKFELLRNVYIAVYLLCCIFGGFLGAPIQVFIGALLCALLGAFVGEYWHQDSEYMDTQMVE